MWPKKVLTTSTQGNEKEPTTTQFIKVGPQGQPAIFVPRNRATVGMSWPDDHARSANPGSQVKATPSEAHIPSSRQKRLLKLPSWGQSTTLYRVSQITEKSKSVQPPFVGGQEGSEQVTPTSAHTPTFSFPKQKRKKVTILYQEKWQNSPVSSVLCGTLQVSVRGWGWEGSERWQAGPSTRAVPQSRFPYWVFANQKSIWRIVFIAKSMNLWPCKN